MGQYLAAVFTDLQLHSEMWARLPRDRAAGMIAEYRYVADSLAGQFGPLHRKFTGDGHLFLFEGADTAVRFGLGVIEGWRTSGVPAAGAPRPSLRVGCHLGECLRMEDEWVGRGIILAKRVEGLAAADSVFVTETVLEFLDLPLYEHEPAGLHELKGDHLPSRMLHRIHGLRNAGGSPDSGQTAEGWFLRGIAQRSSRGARADEERCYRVALRLRPDYPECHNNLGVVLRERGDEAAAAEHYREALRLRRDYPEAHYNYGILLEERGSINGAEHHYRAALEGRPDYVDAHHRLANLLLRARRRVEAETHYIAAITLRPQYAEAHNNYAIFLEDAGRDADASEHYEKALALRPSYPEAHYNYALLLERMGNFAGARTHYDVALLHRPDYVEAMNNLAAMLHAAGDFAGAERHYREAIRIRPNEPETHYNLALLLQATGQQEEAARHMRTALDLSPSRPDFQSVLESGDAPAVL